MSNHDNEHDERAGNPSLEDELWGAQGGGESLVEDSEPGFDNREARDTLSESLDDPTDATPKDELEEEPAPKKKSNLPFYGAVGAFAVVALGLLGYKSGLIGGASKKPIEPSTVASAMASETSKKPESLIGAASASNAASPDLLGGGEAKARPALEAEADLLSEKSAGFAPAPGPTATSVAPAPSPEARAAASPAPTPAPTAATAPVATAPVVAEKPAVVATPAEIVKPEAPVAAPAAAVATVNPTRGEKREAVAAPAKAASSKRERPARVVTAAKATPQAKVAEKPRVDKPVRVAEARKPSKRKGAGKVDKDATPESKEVLAGWKLRGTWPSHGQSQLAWIADESGRLTTVSVGTLVSGARVVSIGKRGEVVQTTAGQILP